MANKKKPSQKPSKIKKAVKKPIIERNRLLHTLFVAFNLLLAGATMLAMAPAIYPLSLGYVTDNLLSSTDTQTVLVPASRVILDYDIRWELLALLAVAFVYSLLVITRWRKGYEKAQDKGRIYLWRWVYLGVSGALIIKLAGVVNGVDDLVALKLSAALMLLAMGFAWLSERQNEKARKPVWSAFLLLALSGFLSFSMIVASMIGTAIYGMVSLPAHAYMVGGLALVNFLLIGMTLKFSNKRTGRWKDYAYVEQWYSIASALSIIAIAGVLITAF